MAYNTEGCVTQLNRANKVDISSLSWNAEYQLTGTTVGGVTVSYTYDVLGRKASRAAGANTEYYIYDGIDLVAEMDGAGNVVRTYTYGPGMDDILSMTIHGSSGTTNYYYLKDLSNTVLALANSSGSIVESYVYDAYGNVTIKNGSGTVIPTSAYGNRFLFQGREYDYTTQLYHFRARWYDSETGRWLSNDPIGISGGLNLYAFCSNDPVNFVDPMGLKTWFLKEYDWFGHEWVKIGGDTPNTGTDTYGNIGITFGGYPSGGFFSIFYSAMSIESPDVDHEDDKCVIYKVYETTPEIEKELFDYIYDTYRPGMASYTWNGEYSVLTGRVCGVFSKEVELELVEIMRNHGVPPKPTRGKKFRK
jgi:RHS repeat-associated protein